MSMLHVLLNVMLYVHAAWPCQFCMSMLHVITMLHSMAILHVFEMEKKNVMQNEAETWKRNKGKISYV
jgi:hypothetical protein